MLSQWDIIIRLVLAVVLGGMIGLERERLHVGFRTYSAGFRTHILVCLGAALAMVVSVQIHYEFRGDAARIAAQVVSGIGFLGAGAILREGFVVRGLTTAASLWVAASIGLAVGGGYYLAATLGTLLVLFALVILGTIEDYVRGKRHQGRLRVMLENDPAAVQRVGELLEAMGATVRHLEIQRVSADYQMLVLALRLPAGINRIELLNRLAGLEGVCRVEHLND
ncbi:MgtC/SapB family protein [Desulfurispora thermophila]|uniref:MgtC/SapB family protein n=1 Tax=Desulfurispora thermophila TaxID=265470 RepID=UPI00035D044D|nr:MgtC/SapB family protein [Desulfurispora thermophila]